MIRAVLDTNVLISFLFIKQETNIWRLNNCWQRSEFETVLSLAALKELVEVLSRARVQDRAGVEIASIKQLLRDIVDRSIMVQPKYHLTKVLTDETDHKFLESALTAKAQFVVSGDKDLLSLQQYFHEESKQLLKIVNTTKFLSILEGGG